MMSEDLDAFLDTADFAEVAVFAGLEIAGIFDNGFAASFEVAGSVPTFTCKEADVADIEPGTSTLTIRSSSWLVLGVEDDGTGLSVLRLQQA